MALAKSAASIQLRLPWTSADLIRCSSFNAAAQVPFLHRKFPFPSCLASDTVFPQAGALSGLATWQDFADQARKHKLSALLVHRARSAGRWDEAPESVTTPLASELRQAGLVALKRRAALISVLKPLCANAQVPMVYKGAALSHLVYPDPEVRSMCDVDLCLPTEQLADAAAILAQEGFVEAAPKTARPLAWQYRYGREIKMHHPVLGLVELHNDLFPGEWLHLSAKIDRNTVWQRRERVTLCGYAADVPCVRDHLLQVVLHAAVSNRHSINGLRGLLDVALLSDHVTDWDALVKDAVDWKVARVVGHTFGLSGMLFDRPKLLQVATILGRRRSQAPLRWFMRPKHVLEKRVLQRSAGQWLFLLCAVDLPIDALRMLKHALWPSEQWLQLRYGEVSDLRRVRIAHFLNVIRGQP